MFRRALRFLLWPVARLLLRNLTVDNPWERFEYQAPLHVFGGGSRRDFSWYFEGESTVTIRSLEEVQEWLAGCDYAHDPHLFQEDDFWQHPRTFEHLKKGDCEDFALWAWRKLVELGYDADLVVGRCVPPESPGSRHAWIVFRRDGETFVFEPGWRDQERRIRVLADVRDQYIPEFGVGPDRKRFAFAGYLFYVRDMVSRTKRRPVEVPTAPQN